MEDGGLGGEGGGKEKTNGTRVGVESVSLIVDRLELKWW